MKEAYIETKAAQKVQRLIKKTVDANGMCRVVGDVGMGKTAMKNRLMQVWEGFPARFRVIHIQSFALSESRISIVMKRMIKVIAPDEHVPGSPELAYDTLRNVLAHAHMNRIKPVLVFDEAQHLSEITMLEIKKIHEISALGVDHLFAVVMFAKPSYKHDLIFMRPELGKRFRSIELKKPDASELLEMAAAYGIRFPKGKEGETLRRQFTGVTEGTPLGVKNLARHLYTDIPDFDGMLTYEIFRSATNFDFIARLKKVGLGLKDAQEEYRRMFGKTITISQLSKIANGRESKANNETERNALTALESLLARETENLQQTRTRAVDAI